MNQNPAKEAAILSGDFHEYEMEHSRVDWDIIRSCTREGKAEFASFRAEIKVLRAAFVFELFRAFRLEQSPCVVSGPF